MAEILLIHGLRDRRDEFSMLIDPLSQFGTVVAPDAPGHVEPLDHPFQMVEWLDDIERRISRAANPPILFGLSAGGHIAMAAAARQPGRVKAVVACDTPLLLPRQRLLSEDIQAILMEDERKPLVHFLVEGDLDAYFEGFPEDAVHPAITCPVLLVGGDESQGALLTQGEIDRAITVLPRAEGLALSGVGHHLGIRTDPDVLVASVTPFLEQHTRPSDV